ncbi:MAG: ABC transporter ATP-binding protein [Nitrospinae bacterium]|nr:ABC transporter ATP-binding protein [Nitrospinota bacterium]
MLKVDGVDVFYGDMQVLWEVSLTVGDAEIVALLGSNGAGKSTTIKTVSGLLKPQAGQIEFDGVRLDQIPANRIIHNGIAHVPEGRRLFTEMTVEENLIMGSLRPEAKRARTETMGWVYDLFPRLRERRKQPAGTLSGGEQQMAAIGRGLMAKPKLLLLDEPSLGLSPLLAMEIFRIVKVINEAGVAVLLVEQNVKRSLAICHRAYVLENGRMTLSGTGAELSANEKVKEAYLGI